MSTKIGVDVIGGTGYLGSHVVKTLSTIPHVEVTVQRQSYYVATKTDVVIDCSGFVMGVHGQQANQHQMYVDNVLQGHRILQACERVRTPLITVGSTCMLGDDGTLETPPHHSVRSYAMAKRHNLQFATDLHAGCEGFRTHMLVLPNLMGPGRTRYDSNGHFPAILCHRLAEAHKFGYAVCKMNGRGDTVRVWLDVRDAANAIASCALDLAVTFHGVIASYNVIAGIPKSTGDIAKMLADAVYPNVAFEWTFDTSKYTTQMPYNVIYTLRKHTIEESIVDQYHAARLQYHA